MHIIEPYEDEIADAHAMISKIENANEMLQFILNFVYEMC